MASRFLPRDRLKWAPGEPKVPIWPFEPDIAVIRSFTSSVIQDSLPPDFRDETCLEVVECAPISFKRTYSVTHSTLGESYLFTVILPVDPVLLLESKVATTNYVHYNTRVPVPRVIAWDSSPKNALGYEWCLADKSYGVPLTPLWKEMAWRSKLDVVEQLAMHCQDLWSQHFDKIGSIYYKSRLAGLPGPSDGDYDSALIHASREESTLPAFDIGPIVSSHLFTGRRQFVPAERGPFTSCKKWVESRIRFELEFIIAGNEILQDDPTTNPLDLDLPEYFVERLDELQDLCHTYFFTLSKVFGTMDPPVPGKSLLSPSAMNLENILVDPNTYRITGILDWCCVSATPSWISQAFPGIFSSGHRLDRQRKLEVRLLRDHFRRTLTGLGHSVKFAALDKPKQRFYEGVDLLNKNWKRARKIIDLLEPLGDYYQESDDSASTPTWSTSSSSD
ncbi:hypothetical protein CDV55_101784 [Aspergillus turcosus]|uniref:Aminoglycoside phosphotransferase domain-containing protein n=1 Tax=Aspergillus turcosus TaxID=1245748 RepID=A0A229WXS7_9EURO|nr:hypothetical protein CDV55_101784 [Aspergillus turcosus]RLL95725.1 hypothetical protein CFD26_105114 [Aspergillus turcosus]